MTKSKTFLFFCLSFIFGIFLESFFNFHQLILLVFLILGVLLISVFWKYKKLVVIGFCLLFLTAGIWRHHSAELEIINSELRNYNDLNQEITLIGIVARETDIRESSIKLTISPEKIGDENGPRSIRGKVLVITNRYPEYQYGDFLKITGFLKTPESFEDFNYQDYLVTKGIYSLMYFPKIELLNKNHGNLIYTRTIWFKNKFREKIYQNLSPPQGPILAAVTLGDESKISQNWKEKLNITGVRHITAVSGMNIIILAGILMWLGLALRLWRGQAFYFALAWLIFYIISIGAPSSALRAGIMGGLLLFAQKIGRLNSSDRALIFAAAVMLLINPLLLKSDVGFQLSFLATLGIVYLMSHFQDWLGFFPNPEHLPLRDLIAMTLSAQVFTLPILIYNFGYLSLVTLLTNILIVPLLPAIMVLGFILGLAGMLWHPLGWLISLPSWLLLTYSTKIVDWFSQIPLTTLTIENLHWVWLVIFYLILGYLTFYLKQKEKLKFLQY